METAKCIAISTGLKSSNQKFLEISGADERSELIEKVKSIEKDRDSVIVVEGDTLQKILKDKEMREAFINYSSLASSVVCCRCAPFQKSEIATAIKKQLNKVICCVGDGGNDVAMIQKGDVGIGIEGKEGRQAALASDFSVPEFKTLAPLILWTGRLSYVRTSLLANFVIHRGLIIAVIQFIYTVMFSYTTIPIYNGYLMLGYATIFTCIPVFSLTFDEDVTYRQVFEYPILYRELQKGREMSISTFIGWAWISIFQGTMLIAVSLVLFENSFFELVTITFTALILIEMLNIATSVRKWHPAIMLGIALSFIIYGCCLIFFRHFLMLSEITWQFGLKVLLITAASWIPIKVFDMIRNCMFPTLAYKIQKEEKAKNGQTIPHSQEQTVNMHEDLKD